MSEVDVAYLQRIAPLIFVRVVREISEASPNHAPDRDEAWRMYITFLNDTTRTITRTIEPYMRDRHQRPWP
jgi:hypothetical protein